MQVDMGWRRSRIDDILRRFQLASTPIWGAVERVEGIAEASAECPLGGMIRMKPRCNFT
jgi:hypothetical protein